MKKPLARRTEPHMWWLGLCPSHHIYGVLSGTKAFSSRSQRIALSGPRFFLALSGMREVPVRTPVGISLSREGRSLADGCSVPAATLRVRPAESQFSAARRPAIRFQASAIAAPLRESTGEEAIASRRRRPDARITRSSPPPCASRLVQYKRAHHPGSPPVLADPGRHERTGRSASWAVRPRWPPGQGGPDPRSRHRHQARSRVI